MTAQKRYILKQIEEIYRFMQIDSQLAYGFVPAGAYDKLYLQIDELYNQLAKLRHYNSAEEMFNDPRGMIIIEDENELPF